MKKFKSLKIIRCPYGMEKMFKKALSNLPPREFLVYTLRHGLFCKPHRTVQVAEIVVLSRMNVLLYYNRACRKLFYKTRNNEQVLLFVEEYIKKGKPTKAEDYIFKFMSGRGKEFLDNNVMIVPHNVSITLLERKKVEAKIEEKKIKEARR